MAQAHELAPVGAWDQYTDYVKSIPDKTGVSRRALEYLKKYEKDIFGSTILVKVSEIAGKTIDDGRCGYVPSKY